jgi:hypothetical protein
MYQKKILGGKMPSIKLRKGQSVVRSVKGARGFCYPADSIDGKLIIEKNCTGEQMMWKDHLGLNAYAVTAGAFKKEDRYPGHASKMVVWK